MRNFKVFFVGWVAVLGIAAVIFYGATKVIASDDHKHEDEHEHHDEHEPKDEHDEHKGHDHDDDHSVTLEGEREEHGHDHGEGSHEEGVIKLSPESQKLGGIEVKGIGSEPFVRKISVNGRIAQDVENVTHVHFGSAGQVTECYVSLGQPVEEGDRLCGVAVKDSEDIVEVKAPVPGTIIAEYIKKGDHVDGTSALYTIADMTRLPANFDVYEKDLAHIQFGQNMNVYPIAFPERSFPAKIVFISPRVDESTFTTRIKAVVDNPEQVLKLGMSLRAEIEVVDGASYITVPSDAVLNVEGEDVVFVKTGDETFEKRAVEVRSRTSGEAAVSGGLNKGGQVVVSGAFILKSKLLESEMEHAHDH